MPAAASHGAARTADQRAAWLAAETGAVTKPRALPALLLVYANRYHVGMSNLGMQMLYGAIADRDDLRCERAFIDKALGGASLETATPVGAFPVWLVSIAFEMDYINLVRLCTEQGVPPRAADRGEREPLLVLGGMAPLMNPEPLAPFADAIYLGEVDDRAGEIFDALERTWGQSRQRRLRALAAIPGMYIPSAVSPVYDDAGHVRDMQVVGDGAWPVVPQEAADLSAGRAVSRILTPHTEFADRVLIQISRGCGRGCRFCFAAFANTNRHVSLARLCELIAEAHAGGRAVGLVASDLSDYPHMDELVQFLVQHGVRFSVSSVRAETVSDVLLDGLRASGQGTLTLAPEVATVGLQRVLHKEMPEGEVLRKAERALEKGFRNIKLYFLLGVPREEWSDVEAIVDMACECRELVLRYGRERGTVGEVHVSANPFVPKPRTPFGEAPMLEAPELRRRIDFVKDRLRREPHIKVGVESLKWAQVQAIFARGDRRTADLIEDLAAGTPLSQAKKRWPLSWDDLLAARWPRDTLRPWSTVHG